MKCKVFITTKTTTQLKQITFTPFSREKEISLSVIRISSTLVVRMLFLLYQSWLFIISSLIFRTMNDSQLFAVPQHFL
ncbi:hypothetical protein FGO68_gene11764 [Halteria grandinella]|uniref:Uncharacterized protein n=1 Tax=Halteria grandinella TaxID=5974 RepID=A0A8J8T5R4_HALGN|nr:hypothetical protein FGO68_gene11764 [Halteria grandinella]